MNKTAVKPAALLLSLAIASALTACAKQEATANASTEKPAVTADALTLDESKLPPVNRFAIGDLDTTKDACTDFGGY
ncbi:MAG TPA: peptidase, partial [Lysobacter sp.]|nr:peptidase [Lysobacter sp.]